MLKCWILTNRIDYFSSHEDIVIGVFSEEDNAIKALKKFVKTSNCRWECDSEDGKSYVRLRKTKFRVGSDEFVYLQESVLDGVEQKVWKSRVRPQSEDKDGEEES